MMISYMFSKPLAQKRSSVDPSYNTRVFHLETSLYKKSLLPALDFDIGGFPRVSLNQEHLTFAAIRPKLAIL